MVPCTQTSGLLCLMFYREATGPCRVCFDLWQNCSCSIELHTDISLSERARLVHPWPLRGPTRESPSFISCRTFPAVLCFLRFAGHFRLFFSFFSFRFVCVHVLGARHRGRARHRRGCQRVQVGIEEGLKGARSPFSCLGIACDSRYEGSMKRLGLASICIIIQLNMYELQGSFGIAR